MYLEVRRKREGAFHYHAPRGLRIRRQYVIEYSLWFNEWKAGFHYSGKGLFSKATSCPPTICRALPASFKALHAANSKTKDWGSCISVALYSSILFFSDCENNKLNLKSSPKLLEISLAFSMSQMDPLCFQVRVMNKNHRKCPSGFPVCPALPARERGQRNVLSSPSVQRKLPSC